MPEEEDLSKEYHEKERRRLDHIEKDAQSHGRYGREPKEVPPKPVSSRETEQAQQEILRQEIEKKMQEREGNMVRDPVCGKMINPDEAEHKVPFGEEELAFCSKDCLEKYKQSPGDFIEEPHS